MTEITDRYLDIAAIEAQIEAANSAIAQAQETVAKREQEVADAKQAAEALRDRLREGDESVTAQKLANADAAVERAQLLLTAARSALNKAGVSKPVVPNLAVAVAEQIGDSLGFPVHAVAEIPKDYDGSLPIGFVQQKKALEDHPLEGFSKGEVTLTVLRTTLHRTLDPSEISGAVVSNNLVDVEVDLYSQKDRDRYRITVGKAWLIDLPILRGVSNGLWRYQPPGVLREVASNFFRHSYGRPGIVVWNEEKKATMGKAKDGLQEVIGKSKVHLWINPGLAEYSEVRHQVEKAMQGTIGKYVPGLGKRVSVEIEWEPASVHHGVLKHRAVAPYEHSSNMGRAFWLNITEVFQSRTH